MQEEFKSIEQLEKFIPTFDKAEITGIIVKKEKVIEHQAIWNTTKGYLECICPKKYGLIQHEDAFLPVIRAIKEKKLKVTISMQGAILDQDQLFFRIVRNLRNPEYNEHCLY